MIIGKCKEVITYVLFDIAHTGRNIADLILAQIDKYEVKIFTLSLENASNNNVEHIKNLFSLAWCQ